MSRNEEHGRNIDLLMVEDQGVMRALVRDFLQSNIRDLTIAEAADGAKAMKLVIERRPRVVLMDISLPDANGIELAARITALEPAPRVIMVTSAAGCAYLERAEAAGAFAFVQKDKIYTELLPLVVQALTAAPRPGTEGGGA